MNITEISIELSVENQTSSQQRTSLPTRPYSGKLTYKNLDTFDMTHKRNI